MGVRFNTGNSNTIVNATIVTTAETIVVASTPVNLMVDNAQIMILWYACFTVGTTATSFRYRLYRGPTTGFTVIDSETTIPCTAATNAQANGLWIDTPGVVANQQYSISLTLPAATANSTVLSVCMLVMVL